MGMGAKNKNNKHQRIYTFTLDDRDEEQKKLMKWLETQSTKAAVLEGLKLVRQGYNTVSGVNKTQEVSQQNNVTSEQISQLINLLTITLSNNLLSAQQQLNPTLLQQMLLQQAEQNQAQSEQSATTEEAEAEVEEEELIEDIQWENASEQAEGLDLGNYGS